VATLRLTLEYDGTGFRGWARQPGERTVEGALREALDAVLPRWDGLAVAGRTDAGVHAKGQIASLEADGGPPLERLAEAFNSELPDDVAVVAADEVPSGFHARFSATGRTYRYVVLNRRERAPLRARRALWWPRPLDEGVLAACAAALPGEHDFTAFTPTETQHEAFRRKVRAAAWERHGDELHFTVTADSFLRHMVRTLVGTMLEAPESLPGLLGGRPRSEAGQTAPPWGLYLEGVEYSVFEFSRTLREPVSD
jgi:tRNA pseudouridine38-40 synthase